MTVPDGVRVAPDGSLADHDGPPAVAGSANTALDGSRADLEREQEHVRTLYARLDALRAAAREHLAEVARETGGTPQARTERDAAFTEYSARLSRLEAAENGLCFGRLDLRSGDRFYLGRVGLPAESRDADPLLLDWRAPAARPFYVATSAAPEGVHRRRHLVTRDRQVLSVDDEVLDGVPDADLEPLAGEAALLAAVNAGRTGRMGDIVATLQAEQDAIIRSDQAGVLVVQGGPGTGKTAVALHRAAYLLYHHQRVATQGVLVVGPNATFLRYIGQVLPGLGETSVLLSTVGALFPGVVASRPEAPAVVEVKGRTAMAGVIAAAVREHQAPPGEPIVLRVGDETVRLTPQAWVPAAERARAGHRPHNRARAVFVRLMLDDLARQLADQGRELAERLDAEATAGLGVDLDAAARGDLARLGFGADPDADEPAHDPLAETAVDLRELVAGDQGVRNALDALWPRLTPQRLLADLFASPERLAAAAPGFSAADRALLVRPHQPLHQAGTLPLSGWSEADVPLLDEAGELLGVDDREARARASAAREEEIAYAQGLLDIATGSADDYSDEEVLAVGDLLDARRLAERNRFVERGSVADRAAADRTWTFGHVIVDEAQELSPMAWRALMRRCPSRSMTLVGDVAQTSSPAGTTSWAQTLEPFVGDRFRLATLSVNYRTPAEIMAATADLVATLGAGVEPPRAVRESGVPPWREETTADGLPARLAAVVAEEAAALDEGRLAVIVPDARVAELSAGVPDAESGAEPDLAAKIVVLGAGQAKGLEFDVVLVADPAGILAASARGRNDLYVALTRATQRLGLLHPGPVPAELASVKPR